MKICHFRRAVGKEINKKKPSGIEAFDLKHRVPTIAIVSRISCHM
jgi:hypothetical protein